MSDTASLQRSAASIRDTLQRLRDARTAAHDIADKVERDLELWRVDRLAATLTAELAEASAIEAGEERTREVREAVDAIAKFNVWLATRYETAACEIAAGIELEREAWRLTMELRRGGLDPATLPPIARAYVHSSSNTLERFTRLPAIEAGEPIVWP